VCVCVCVCIGVGKSSFTVVRMEKDMQVMIITIALLTQKKVIMAHCTEVQSRYVLKLPTIIIYTYNTRINSVFRVLKTLHLLLPTPIYKIKFAQ
jgi:hypothetical protein